MWRSPDIVARDEALIRWLSKRDPDEWHRVALSWNWDSGYMVLRWIIQQPDCDRATALLIFWRGDVAYYLPYGHRDEVPEPNGDVYDLLCEIRQNWIAGKYRRSELAYDSEGGRDMDFARRRLGSRLKFIFPRDMEQSLAGRVLTCEGYEEGLPPDFVAHYESNQSGN